VAKYSTFKYGDGTEYGAADWDANLLWGFVVAWTGEYTGANEAEKMIGLTVQRGRKWLLGKGGLAPFEVGEATATFDNTDGRYDPYNTSSPLYPNVAPGKYVRIMVRDDENTTTYGVMRGKIEDIVCMKRGAQQVAMIKVVDGLSWFKGQTLNVGLQTDQDKSTLIRRLLSYSSWPQYGYGAEWSAYVQEDTDVVPYYWAWNQNAWDALQEFNQAEWAVAFHDKSGWFTWRPRDFTHNRSQEIDEDVCLADIGRPNPWEVVRNEVRITASPKIYDNINAIIWQLQTVPAIADGESFYIEPIFRYGEFFKVCGASITNNFTVNTQADGGGADLSAGCTLTAADNVGEGNKLTLVNNSGSAGHITLLKATGDAIYAPSIDVRQASDGDSQSVHGLRTLGINSRWVIDTEFAQTQADWLLSEFKDAKQYPIIQIEDRAGYQYYLDLYDRVQLTAATLGIDDDFRVGHIAHEWLSENGQSVRTTFRLEPYMVQT